MDNKPAPHEEPVYEVVWPSGKSTSKQVNLSAAIADLNGKTICQLWDWMFRGDEMYAIINEALKSRYPDIRIVSHETMGNIDGRNQKEYIDSLPNLLRKFDCDAVLSAVGA